MSLSNKSTAKNISNVDIKHDNRWTQKLTIFQKIIEVSGNSFYQCYKIVNKNKLKTDIRIKAYIIYEKIWPVCTETNVWNKRN